MTVSNHIIIQQEPLASMCRKYHIRRLSVFGSALRGDFGPASDIDLLVEFEPEHIPGLAFFRIEEEMSVLFGKKIDLNTAEFLSRYFRDEVLHQAETIYEA